MKFWVYFLLSIIASIIVLVGSALLYPNYPSSLIGIHDSTIKECLVLNLAACVTYLWFKFVAFLFLGELHHHEFQSIYQRGWVVFCNSLLFWGTSPLQRHINPYDLGNVVFSGLTVLVLHWICESRVKTLQAYDSSQMTKRYAFKVARLSTLCIILGLIDIALCQVAIEQFKDGKYIIFFFIYLIDLVEMAMTFNGELAINLYAIYHLYRNEEDDEWELSKLLTECVHMLSALVGATAHGFVVYKFGIWSSDIGSIIMRVIRLFQSGSSLVLIFTAASELDKFTSLATAEELSRDNTCVICRDDMDIELVKHKRKAARKLGCGHVLHAGCLESWLSQSENCPTCRQSVRSAASAFRDAAATASTNNTENSTPEGAVAAATAAAGAAGALQQPASVSASASASASASMSATASASSPSSASSSEAVPPQRGPDVSFELLADPSLRLGHGRQVGGRHTVQIPRAEHLQNLPSVRVDRIDELREYFRRTRVEGRSGAHTTASSAATSSSSLFSPAPASSDSDSQLHEKRHSNIPAAINVQMTDESNGLLADRYHFKLDDISSTHEA